MPAVPLPGHLRLYRGEAPEGKRGIGASYRDQGLIPDETTHWFTSDRATAQAHNTGGGLWYVDVPSQVARDWAVSAGSVHLPATWAVKARKLAASISPLSTRTGSKVTSMTDLLGGGPKITSTSPISGGGAKVAIISQLLKGGAKVATPPIDLSGPKITTPRLPQSNQLNDDPRYALSPYARHPARVFRTEDLLPGLAFRHPGGTSSLARTINTGEGLHTPIEIDWDPKHGLATIIQGNHRLLAAQEARMPFIPGGLGQMYGDLGRYISYLKSDPNLKPHHEYGSIKVGSAGEALINRLLSLGGGHPETGGLYSFRRDVKITPEDWNSLISALGLPNVKVKPGTTVDQVMEMLKT